MTIDAGTPTCRNPGQAGVIESLWELVSHPIGRVSLTLHRLRL